MSNQLDLERGRRLVERIADSNPEAIRYGTEETGDLDVYDAAIVGIAERCGQPAVLVYDYRLMVESLAAHYKNQQGLAAMFDTGCPPDDSDPYESAVEWIDFNIVGGWLGEHTPVILYDDE